MVRTQIYLTQKQRSELSGIAARQGKAQSELIREAVDRFLASSDSQNRLEAIQAAAGIWKDRQDLPDFRALRAEWDRD